jgi:hypothetical protein
MRPQQANSARVFPNNFHDFSPFSKILAPAPISSPFSSPHFAGSNERPHVPQNHRRSPGRRGASSCRSSPQNGQRAGVIAMPPTTSAQPPRTKPRPPARSAPRVAARASLRTRRRRHRLAHVLPDLNPPGDRHATGRQRQQEQRERQPRHGRTPTQRRAVSNGSTPQRTATVSAGPGQ